MESMQSAPFPHKKKRRAARYLTAGFMIVILVIGGIMGISGYVGWNLTHPVRQPVDQSPSWPCVSFQVVNLPSQVDRLNLNGWLITAPENRGTVIFAHGYRKNRLNSDIPILPIAQAIVRQGYNALMFDFRNSGLSEGRLTSVGQYETRDLAGAVDYVQSRSELKQPIILFGFSMGASTAILTGAREPAVDAVIADSPFADLKDYLAANLSVWSELPAVPFNQAFFMVVPVLTGLNPESVSPIKEVAHLNGRPLLLIHGLGDVDIPPANSEMLLQAYPEAQLITIPGAGHVKSYATDPAAYIAAVTQFLDRKIAGKDQSSKAGTT